jgi:hypothetical protein
MSLYGSFSEKDKSKLSKAGFATPRGGSKNGYQNHVNRNSRVIIPYERLVEVNLSSYEDGYIILLTPEQYFTQNIPSTVVVGSNAFINYRTEESLLTFPPLSDWGVRNIVAPNTLYEVVHNRRKVDSVDTGHYIIRTNKRTEGVPQGIFAPEYANKKQNMLGKCSLAWLIIHTVNSPYNPNDFPELIELLQSNGVSDFEFNNRLIDGKTTCPLCLQPIHYNELHDIIAFERDCGLENASFQTEGLTRSTVANLFHMKPLVYSQLTHTPENCAWGHATCNTLLGQRPCYSKNLKEVTMTVLTDDDNSMIRSDGKVWIKIYG